MITKVGKTLNRTFGITIPSTDVDNSYVAIDIVIDPSLQLEIYGYGFGYNQSASETSVNSQGNMFITLDYQIAGILNEFPLLYTTEGAFGEMVIFDSIAMQNRNQVFSKQDFANPLIISGRRNLLMVVTKPFTNPAPTVAITAYAYLRGNFSKSEFKVGNWGIR